MNGISYLVDERGERTAAVIDLREHAELWEDIEDLLVAKEREAEETIPWEQVKAELIAEGKLGA